MISIARKNIAHAIPRYIFAHNLEHTRACVYGGLSAQLLKNRKFAGMCDRSGVSHEWERIGSEYDYFYIDQEDAYTRHAGTGSERYRTERNSQKYQNLTGRACGVRQQGIALQKGARYVFGAVVKSDRDMYVNTRLACEEAGRVDAAWQSGFVCDSREWKTYTLDFTSGSEGGHFAFELFTEMPGEVSIGALSLLPGDHFHEMRRDVIRQMQRMGITMLRWPGGNFAGEYRWQDGLMDSDMRAPLCSYMPIETQPYMLGYDNHEIGVNQFMSLCKLLGAEPYITLNLFWDSERESADFLAYCNDGADTHWGTKRAALGYPEPFGVKYWSLGNEMGYGHMEGLNTIERYTAKALSTAAEMKKIDPGIRLCCSGPYPNDAWVRQSAAKLAGPGDFVSYHSYVPMNTHARLKFTGEAEKRASHDLLMRAPYTAMRDILKLRRRIDAALGQNEVNISFDEWNTWYAWYRKPSPGEGLFAGVMLNALCRLTAAFGMPICCYFQPVNEGAVDVGKTQSSLTNIGMVFALYRRHQGGRVIDIDAYRVGDLASAGEAIDAMERADVDILASYREDVQKITITCVNKTHDDVPLRLVFDGFDGARIEEAQALCAEHVMPGYALQQHALDTALDGLTVRKYSILGLTVRVGQ